MHIGIILDGNRRYARRLLLNPLKGHESGVEVVKDLFKWAIELGVDELSLFCFSTENFGRKKEEVDYLLSLMGSEFSKLKDSPKVMENKIRMRFIGRLSLFPQSLQSLMSELESKTKGNGRLTVNFCVAYGGRAEIVDAAKKIADMAQRGIIGPEQITEKMFMDSLYLNSEPDLIIRTSGEKRLSNFLTFQSTYSELHFIDKLWPEFTKDDLQKAIEDYNQRDRRKGI
ncbi:MAG: polyprenyl diphosphate synthase [Nanoarchaeota archaeon]